MKHRKIYLLISGTLIVLGIFSLLKWGLTLGIDFRGGTIAEYFFDKGISTEEASRKLESEGINVFSIQSSGENKYFFRAT